MLWCRIHVRLFHDCRLEGACALHCGVEVVHLKPQKNVVPNGRGVGVQEVRVVFLIPGVEFQNELTFTKESLVKLGMIAGHGFRGSLRQT
jgi:hypothetical protein